MLPTVTKIDPRIRRTRKLLFDAFQELLTEKDFDSITVQDITMRATVNRATFYAHFTDKYALVDELIREGFEKTLRNRQEAPAETAEELLEQLFLAVTDHWTAVHSKCRRHYPLFESLAEVQVKRQLRESVHAWFQQHHPQYTGKRQQMEQRLEMIATIVSWAVYGTVSQWSQSGRKQTVQAFIGEAAPVIAASMVAVRANAVT